LKQEEVFTDTNEPPSNKLSGIFAALAAALTESIVYVVTKDFKGTSPFLLMSQLYGGALALFVGGLFFLGKPILSDTR
jgi:drug/metabolite transporter (DMT)-like permease